MLSVRDGSFLSHTLHTEQKSCLTPSKGEGMPSPRVALCLQYKHRQTIPTRHLPLPIEIYQESMPCQHVVTTTNNPLVLLPCSKPITSGSKTCSRSMKSQTML